jgi:hypothetical protein
MTRHILSRHFRLVALTGMSLLLSAQLQAAPPSILDDPAMAPGGSILNDLTPLCGPNQAAAYQSGVDANGQPVVPADLNSPVSVSMDGQVLVHARTDGTLGGNQAEIPVTITGLNAQNSDCVPAGKQRR